MSVCPHGTFGYYYMDIHINLIIEHFSKMSRKLKFHLYLRRTLGKR